MLRAGVQRLAMLARRSELDGDSRARPAAICYWQPHVELVVVPVVPQHAFFAELSHQGV
jgi:hypothetical protein